MTGDEPQGTMGRVQTAGEATSRPLSPSRLPLRTNFHQKRDVWVRGSVRGEPFVNGRYTKGVPVLSEMVYIRLRDRTLGGGSRYKTLLSIPLLLQKFSTFLPAKLVK